MCAVPHHSSTLLSSTQLQHDPRPCHVHGGAALVYILLVQIPECRPAAPFGSCSHCSKICALSIGTRCDNLTHSTNSADLFSLSLNTANLSFLQNLWWLPRPIMALCDSRPPVITSDTHDRSRDVVQALVPGTEGAITQRCCGMERIDKEMARLEEVQALWTLE